ncbi:DUF2306 domain-containing protein [Ktedonospora formicarum]|uniref:DUF2306 domain-containing protein n=1 Tax=Ktedonospora formicarum TaxID=2778364 RepID=A0A8J3I7U1_9CHLR|nr:DUF2306 domain-containing protein [Ktedonospora formicarum]GHO47403.1 hypothetical protein KSX_55660 [Ktedonospora formicarum]
MSTSPLASASRPIRRYIGWGILTFLAVSTAIFVAGRYVTFDPTVSLIPLNRGVVSHFVVLALHGLTGGLALLLGPFQFVASIRTRAPIIHRLIGRVYLLSVMLGSIFACFSALVSTSGFVAQASFLFLAVIWCYSAVQAYVSIRRGQIQLHRLWMIRNYALTFSAVALRLWLVGGIVYLKITTGNVPEPVTSTDIYASGTWISWIVSLIIAEWFLIQRKRILLSPQTRSIKRETKEKIVAE